MARRRLFNPTSSIVGKARVEAIAKAEGRSDFRKIQSLLMATGSVQQVAKIVEDYKL